MEAGRIREERGDEAIDATKQEAAGRAGRLTPLPKNVGRLISEYVDCKKNYVFFMLTSC